MLDHDMEPMNVVTRAGRFYTTEAGDGRLCAAWLNAAGRTPAAKRILNLREELERLLRLREPGRAQYLQRAGLPAINARLEVYLFSPALSFNADTHQFHASPLPKSRPGPTAMLDSIEIDEATVAAALVRLTAQRRLSLLHLCDCCGAVWHVASRAIDRFCSTRCRDAWHASTPEGRARRREIQRRYRANIKAQEIPPRGA